MDDFGGAFGEVFDVQGVQGRWSYSLGPWLGGYLPAIGDPWEWIGSEGVVTFTDWMHNPEYEAPDNYLGEQDRMHFNSYTDVIGQIIGWDDIGHDSERIMSFVVERPAPVPEPATMLLFGTGLAGLAGFSIRRKEK